MVRRKTRRFRWTSFSSQAFQDADFDMDQSKKLIVRKQGSYSFEKEGKVSYVCIEGAET